MAFSIGLSHAHECKFAVLVCTYDFRRGNFSEFDGFMNMIMKVTTKLNRLDLMINEITYSYQKVHAITFQS